MTGKWGKGGGGSYCLDFNALTTERGDWEGGGWGSYRLDFNALTTARGDWEGGMEKDGYLWVRMVGG